MLSKNTEESRDLLACKAFLYNKINGKSTKFPLKINFKLEESWVNGLIDTSENFHKKRSNIENVFYMPNLPQYLKYLGRTVFLWSSVLPAMIGAQKLEASSADLESFFNKFKNNLLDGELNTLTDFLQKPEMFLKGEINSKTSKHKLIMIIELILIISKTTDNSRAIPTDIIKRLIETDEFLTTRTFLVLLMAFVVIHQRLFETN